MMKLKNQIIAHFLVVPTFYCSLIFYGCILIILLIFGIVCLSLAGANIDYEKRYDDLWENEAASGGTCTFTIKLDEKFEDPYIYYKIGNFFANHRDYVKSRSYKQLRGEKVAKGDVELFCDPILDNEDIPVTKSYTGKSLKPKDLAYPCGLIGKYRFTDIFMVKDSSMNEIKIESGSIAHTNDKKFKFKNLGDSDKDIQWLDHEEQRLMVWYQMESFPNFIKLYGKIEGTLEKGEYTITVDDIWDTKSIKAEKYLYISTINAFGGTNVFLGKTLLKIN